MIIRLKKEDLKIDKKDSFKSIKKVLGVGSKVMKYTLGKKAQEEMVLTAGFLISQFSNAQHVGYKVNTHIVYNEDGTVDNENSRTILMVAADFALNGIDVNTAHGREIYNFVNFLSAITSLAYIATKDPEDVSPEEDFSEIEIDVQMGQEPVIKVVK